MAIPDLPPSLRTINATMAMMDIDDDTRTIQRARMKRRIATSQDEARGKRTKPNEHPACETAPSNNSHMPPVTIDHTAFPHIIEAIMYASFESLLAFRTTSRAYRKVVDEELKVLCISTCEEFTSASASATEKNTMVEFHTRRDVLLDSMAATAFDRRALKICRYLAGNQIPTVFQVSGESRPDIIYNALSALHAPPCDAADVVISSTELWLVPDADADGAFPRLTSGLYAPVITLVDNWRAAPWPLCSETLSFRPRSAVLAYPIDGRATTTTLVRTPAPFYQIVVYDFSTWRPARGGSQPYVPGQASPRFMSIVGHAARAVCAGCQVWIAGLEVVDPAWLDPLYVTAEPWFLFPNGSLTPTGSRIAFETYLCRAIGQQVLNWDRERGLDIRWLRWLHVQIIPAGVDWRTKIPCDIRRCERCQNWLPHYV